MAARVSAAALGRPRVIDFAAIGIAAGNTGGSESSTASPAVGTSRSMPECQLQWSAGQAAATLVDDRPDHVDSGYSVSSDLTSLTQASVPVVTSAQETRASLEQGTHHLLESCSKDPPEMRYTRDNPCAAILHLPVSERPAEMQIGTRSTPQTRTDSPDRQTRQAILLRFATQHTTLERADLYRATDLSNLTVAGVQIKGKTKFAKIQSLIGDKPAYSVDCEGMSCQQITETGALCSARTTFLALYHLYRTQPLLQITSVCTKHLVEKHDWLINCFCCRSRQSLDRRAVSVVCRPKKGVWDMRTARCEDCKSPCRIHVTLNSRRRLKALSRSK